MARVRTRISEHPVHPMLVVIPAGLWVAALAFDIVGAATGNAVWGTLAFWNIVAGIIGALLAAVPGVLDYLTLDGRARRIGTWHLVLNLGAVALFAVNAIVRTRVASGSMWPLTLSIIGVLGVMASGWLGAELVYVERVGVVEPRERSSERPRRAA
jgi:uncharacterized membrane protein